VFPDVCFDPRSYPARALHEFVVEGECPSFQVTLAPHPVMRGDLDFFLQPQAQESSTERSGRLQGTSPELAEYFGWTQSYLISLGQRTQEEISSSSGSMSARAVPAL